MTSEKITAQDGPTVIRQAGAICLRRNENSRLEVLLVGSKRNGRWGVPKGHLDPGETSDAAAAREAFEEAGVLGAINSAPFGSFRYNKDSNPNTYEVTVHLLEVTSIAANFPEKMIRKTKWFPIKSAARDASQARLRALLRTFL